MAAWSLQSGDLQGRGQPRAWTGGPRIWIACVEGLSSPALALVLHSAGPPLEGPALACDAGHSLTCIPGRASGQGIAGLRLEGPLAAGGQRWVGRATGGGAPAGGNRAGQENALCVGI